MVETRTEKDSRRITKKQISFDLDTKVAKAILGKSNYIKAYLDIRKFMEKEGWMLSFDILGKRMLVLVVL